MVKLNIALNTAKLIGWGKGFNSSPHMHFTSLYKSSLFFSLLMDNHFKDHHCSGQLPCHLSIKCNHHQILELDPTFTPSRSSKSNPTTYTLMAPPSPSGSPWSLSPLRTPSPSLLYQCISSLHRQEGTIYSIATSKGGIIFTSSESSQIRAWRQLDCVHSGCVKASSGDVRSMLCYGNLLFTSHRDHKVRIWSVPTLETTFQAKKVTTLPKISSFHKLARAKRSQHKDIISCMAYYHAEGLLYTGSWDTTVKVWKVSETQCVDSFLAHSDHINALAVSQEDGSVFSCSKDGSVKIWRRVYGHNSHTLTTTLKFQPSPINALALSTSLKSSFLYSGSSDGFINFWEKESFSGRFNHGGFLQGHTFSVTCLVAIENLLFSGSEDTTIRVWRREEGSCFHECLAVLDAHRGPVKCLAAVLEMEKEIVMGFLVYSGGLDQAFKVWRVKVNPGETRVCLDGRNGRSDLKMEVMEYEMSPVLSPSWVEKKKLQANTYSFH